MKTLFNSTFYQFVLALAAMGGLVYIKVMGVQDTAVIENVLSGVIGAGVWGGLKGNPAPQIHPGTQPPGNTP